MDSLRPEVDAAFDDIVDLRRDFHAHPELSFEEHRTSGVIRDRLLASGLDVRACPTETGAVAVLEGGRPGRAVLLRADIDALPVQEGPALPFRSSVDGRMHACGHDAHAAMLLGVAQVLAGRAPDLAGTFVFVFQPAEERISGARAMLDAGLLAQVPADVAIGCHIISGFPTGLVGVRRGVFMADAQSFRVELSGAGGHAAVQGRKGDVIVAAARVVAALDDVVAGVRFEGVDGVCSAGLVHAGKAANVVPTVAAVEGTIRTFDAVQADESRQRLELIVAGIAADQGVDAVVTIYGHAPAVDNDPEVTDVVRRAARLSRPKESVFDMPPVTPSDDMSEFLLRMPGSYFFLGAAQPDGSSGGHHSPSFAIDEEALRVGSTVLADAAVALASNEAES
jgi:amidohydrolase